MKIDQLKLLFTVAQQGTIAAAAKQLDMDASTVSRSIAAIEHRLGARLFQRSTRTLTITPEGADYLKRIEPLIEEFDAANAALTKSQAALSGKVRLTCSTAFATKALMPHLAKFFQLYPDIELELIPTDENIDLIREGVDLAIRLAPAPYGELDCVKLMPTRYHLVANAEYAQNASPINTPEDLKSLNCLRLALPAYREMLKFQDNEGRQTSLNVHGNLIIANPLALRAAVRFGLGYALLADWLVAQDLKNNDLVQLLPHYQVTATEFDTSAWLLFPSRKFLPKKVRSTIDFLKNCFTAPK